MQPVGSPVHRVLATMEKAVGSHLVDQYLITIANSHINTVRAAMRRATADLE